MALKPVVFQKKDTPYEWTPEAGERRIRAALEQVEAKAKTHEGIWRAQEAMIQAALEPLGVHGPPWDNHAVEDAADMIHAIRAERDALAARVEALEGGTPGVAAIAAERKRQMEVEGWTAEHDDVHRGGELAEAAACYTVASCDPEGAPVSTADLPTPWPWDEGWWKPAAPRRMLVKAGALIAAEIDRLDRAEKTRTDHD